MKFLLSFALALCTISASAAIPDYKAFRGTGGISIVSNPPSGTIVIDGSSISAGALPTFAVTNFYVPPMTNLGPVYVDDDFHATGNSLLDGSVTGQTGSTWLLPIVSVTQTLGVAGAFDAQGSINTNIIHNRTEDQVGATNDMILVEDVSTATVKRIALGNAPIDWANITGMPAGFADGTDDGAGGGTVGGNTTEIQFNFGGAFDATNDFRFIRGTNLTILGSPSSSDFLGAGYEVRTSGATNRFTAEGSLSMANTTRIYLDRGNRNLIYSSSGATRFGPGITNDTDSAGISAPWRTNYNASVRASTSIQSDGRLDINGNIIIPWRPGAAGTVTASTGPSQIINLISHTNLNFVPLTGAGDNSNSVKIAVVFVQDATGGYYPSNNGAKIFIKTNALARTEVTFWFFSDSAAGSTNVSPSIAFTQIDPTDGQTWVYDKATCTWTNATVTPGATAWDAIGDPSGNGSIAFGGTTQFILSTLDGGNVLSLTNTDADVATDTTLLNLNFHDGGDGNAIFASFIGDADGTPAIYYLFSQTLMQLSANVTADLDAAGSVLVPTVSANDNDTSAASTAFVATELAALPADFSFVTNSVSGWGIHNLQSGNTLTTTLTNRSAGVATNTFTLLADFSDAANKQIYNITQFSTNAITIATTNLVLGRTICVYMSSNMVTYTVTVADTLASAIQWNFNVATNGATSFTKTNSVAARLYLTAETNGVVSAELGYYRK